MAEYAALFRPGEDVTFTVDTGETIVGGTLVTVSGDRKVSTSGVGDTPVGVALFDAAAGEKVTVATGGVHLLPASGAIAAGVTVAAAASGAVASGASGSNAPVGIAVSAAAGDPSSVAVLLTVGGLGLDADTVYTLPAATGAAIGGVKQAAAQADSTATEVSGLVADFNTLLGNLRTAGIIAGS